MVKWTLDLKLGDFFGQPKYKKIGGNPDNCHCGGVIVFMLLGDSGGRVTTQKSKSRVDNVIGEDEVGQLSKKGFRNNKPTK